MAARSHLVPSLGSLRLELITLVISRLHEERPVALICLALTSHYFHDLILSMIDTEVVMDSQEDTDDASVTAMHSNADMQALSRLVTHPNRCDDCLSKSTNLLHWVAREYPSRRIRPSMFLSSIFISSMPDENVVLLVTILENRWRHYHHDWEELMTLLTRDTMTKLAGEEIPER